jgi:SAM-dependent methyltransferase
LISTDSSHHSADSADWEAIWAPYDEATYEAALGFLESSDVVLDIGAGDLRFARRAARRVRHVFAIERNQEVLRSVPRTPVETPENLSVICADALAWSYPEGLTTAVLLMRHCRHFQDYVHRLRAAGCQRLVTNARWGMAVECVSLAAQAPYWAAPPGWYACSCGAVGFKTAVPEEIHAEMLATSRSVDDCPVCLSVRMAKSLQPWSRR